MLRNGLCLATGFALGAAAVPALANPVQESAAASEQPALDPAYLAMFEAMESGVDQSAHMRRQLDALIAEMVKSDAKFRELSAANPAFQHRFKTVITPYLLRHTDNIRPLQRQEMMTLMARYLSPAEARTWATFYASPLGRKVMGAAQQNASYSTVASEVIKSGEVNAASIERDVRRTEHATARAMQGKITLEDQRQMLVLMRRPSYPKFLAMMREAPQVRARLEMTPMDPTLQAEASVAVAEFLLEAQGVKIDPEPQEVLDPKA